MEFLRHVALFVASICSLISEMGWCITLVFFRFGYQMQPLNLEEEGLIVEFYRQLSLDLDLRVTTLLFFINHRIGIEENIRSRLVWVQRHMRETNFH